jgi:trimethylamine---corrinoid protein Co-methyltransferase
MTVADPPPNLPHLHPRLTMLGRADCEQIHQASCYILSRTGVMVYNPCGLELLRSASAQVDGERVRIPAALVDWALTQVAHSFQLFRRGTQAAALELDGTHCYFGPGSDTLRYLDPRTGDRRDFRLADVADCIRLCDALPEIGFVMSVGIPRDVPVDRSYRHQFAAMLRNTVKPIVFVCNDLADIEAIGAMAAAAAGGQQALSDYPTLLLYSEPTTPLSHGAEAVDKLLYCAQHRLPVTHSPAPMMGGTAPVTLAGAVALGNAELLSGLVMHQLKRPGAPFLYGHGVHHLDMKEMISVYGAPEFQLARVMAAEMGRHYRLPVWGYAGHSDSKVLDTQAAIDAQLSVLVALLAGTNLNHDVGYLESGLAASPELIVLTDEIISQSRRFSAGVRLDAEALALEAIDAVGPGGEFMSHAHTFAHWRELWLPQLFDRRRLEPWLERGGRPVEARLKDKTLALMDSHRVPLLPAAVDREIEAILQAR